MRLTYQTDYALRMLVYLAVNNGRPSRVVDVAVRYGISRNHLLKVALRLGRLGYVSTQRGRTGGIALAMSPDEINPAMSSDKWGRLCAGRCKHLGPGVRNLPLSVDGVVEEASRVLPFLSYSPGRYRRKIGDVLAELPLYGRIVEAA